MNTDIQYTFQLSETTCFDYRMTSAISSWLQSNMEQLTDDDNNIIFGRVNTGFNENSLKTFGKKPVCDVYINNVEYSGDFDYHTPQKVHTIIIFYLKGANNNTYSKACELHDYIMQEFIENESFKRLSDIVKETYITNSELMTQPINKKWGVMGAIELSHILY